MTRRRQGADRPPGAHAMAADFDIPADVTGSELSREVRQQLRTLPDKVAESVARHLVMAGRLIDADPEVAYQHARAARSRAARLAVVREACGEAAYASGRYAEALAEFRAVRRMTGAIEYLPVLADCERAIGRPDAALQIAADPSARQLDPAAAVELAIVAAGARLDLGQADVAVRDLAHRARHLPARGRSASRLRYAYAEALLAAGNEEAALTEFGRAAAADPDESTDAAERAAALEGLMVTDTAADAPADPDASPAGSGEPAR